MKQTHFIRMHYLQPTVFLMCISFFLVAAQTKAPGNKKDNLIKSECKTQVDSVMNKYVAEGFSGSILVIKNGQKVFNKSYGFANESTKTKNTAETFFNVASISKIFTSAAILKLESQGKLKTTDLLSKYLGEMLGEKSTATIHHLLCHTAGLVKRGTSLRYSSRDSLIESVKTASLESLPGKEFRYTNVGYSLLAAIVEIASGVSYEEYLAENIIKPAGILAIRHAWEKKIQSFPLAIGYNENGIAQSEDVANWGNIGASSLLMTPSNLYNWIEALSNGKVINNIQVEKMLFDYTLGKESYGFHKEILKDSSKIFWKGGGHPGFESQLLWYPQKGTMIIFFINKNIELRRKIFPDLRKVIE